MKVKYKITLAFIVLAVLLLLSSCLFTFLNTKKQQERDFAKMLQNKALTISSLIFTNKKVNYNILSKVDSASKNLLFSENINVFNNNNERIYHFIENANDTTEVPIKLVPAVVLALPNKSHALLAPMPTHLVPSK